LLRILLIFWFHTIGLESSLLLVLPDGVKLGENDEGLKRCDRRSGG